MSICWLENDTLYINFEMNDTEKTTEFRMNRIPWDFASFGIQVRGIRPSVVYGTAFKSYLPAFYIATITELSYKFSCCLYTYNATYSPD